MANPQPFRTCAPKPDPSDSRLVLRAEQLAELERYYPCLREDAPPPNLRDARASV